MLEKKVINHNEADMLTTNYSQTKEQQMFTNVRYQQRMVLQKQLILFNKKSFKILCAIYPGLLFNCYSSIFFSDKIRTSSTSAKLRQLQQWYSIY
uniref:Transmembrane protein n=1 Tax=Arundo donax TaxID=35708 RepID=A0A0A8XU71_ARUDO